jgi:hypothetical protein
LTKVIVASVLAERAAVIAKSRNPTGKARVGRPKKPESAPSTAMEVDAT